MTVSSTGERKYVRRIPYLRPPKLREETTSLGAISELQVSADLMSKGWEVFRALNPGASCDLMAMRAGEVYRIEVRTGKPTGPNGRIYVSQAGSYDVLAVVNKVTGEVKYFPEME